MNPADVAIAARDRFAAVPGVKQALEYDGDELQGVPAVTLSLRRTEANDRYTGPAQEMIWTWLVRLYLPFGGNIVGSDVGATDALQYDLLPRLFKVIRDDPGLGGACVKSTLGDLGEEPERNTEQGLALKLLELQAWTEEV